MDCTFLSDNRIWHSRALRLAASHAVHLTFSNADEQQETGTHMQECKLQRSMLQPKELLLLATWAGFFNSF